MSTSDNFKVGASKSKCDDAFDELTNKLLNMSTDDTVSVCANCGKEGDDVNNICNKCKMVKYCNAACKKKHRSKHKKQCERWVAELHDEKLFKQPPADDCPICFLLLPTVDTGRRYQSCCGKVICSGCCYAPVYDNQGNKVNNQKCPYCRAPFPYTHEEGAKRIKKRGEIGDARAIHNLGTYYRDGINGFPQDYTKALELWHQAGKLGYADAYLGIGVAYYNGQGVEVDYKKATHYYELAAIRGSVNARYNLGLVEVSKGNMDRAIKHVIIGTKSGHNESLKKIKQMYTGGDATKEDYTEALQSYQAYLGEIKSPQRDKAAATNEYFHYY